MNRRPSLPPLLSLLTTILLLLGIWLLAKPSWRRLYPQRVSATPIVATTFQPSAAVSAVELTTNRYHYQESFVTYQAKATTVNAEWDTNKHQLHLTPRHNQPQQDAIVATGANYSYVVWQDLRRDSGDITVQQLDADGNPRWVGERQANREHGAVRQAEPAAVVDAAGNLIVVWVDQRNGHNDIYAQKLNPQGEPIWLDDVRINQESGNTDQAAPTVAYTQSGSVIVVWHDNRNGDYDLYAQRIDGDGLRQWEADLRVNGDNSTQSQAEPFVGVDATDHMLVVWLDQRIGNHDIYAQRLTDAGQRLWAEDLRINPATDSAQNEPTLAVLANGEALVAWSSANQNGIALQKVSSTGTLLWPTPKSIQLAGQFVDPETAPGLLAVGNAVLVAWRVTPDDQLYLQHLDVQGNKSWPQPLAITQPSHIVAPLHQIMLGAPSTGKVLVAWPVEASDDQQGIYSQQIDQNGTLDWPVALRVSSTTGSVDQTAPALVVTAAGQSIIAWQDGRAAAPGLYVQRFTSDGQRLWRDQVSASRRAFTEPNLLIPDLAIIDDDALVAWADERSGVMRIYAQRLDRRGHRLWNADRPASRAQASTDAQSNPVIGAHAGSATLAWEEERGQQRLIVAQRIDAEGIPQWQTDVVVSDSATNPRAPAVAVDAAGYTTLVWSVSASEQTDLFSQRLDSSGGPVWAQPVRVNQTPGLVDKFNPAAVAMDPAGNATVVWVDRRQNALYGQRLNAAGQPVWATDILLSPTPGAAVPNPDVAMTSDGRAHIVWQGLDASGQQTILAQRLDPTGQPLWQTAGAPVIFVSPLIRAGSQPRIAVDSVGNSTIAWQDQRAMNPDIYVQRLDVSGNRLWPAEQMVIGADHFYAMQGRVQSKVIDTVDAPITQARLGVTLERQGGAVDFALSNDDGAHWATVQPGVSHLFTTTGSALRWQAILTNTPHRLSTTPIVHEVAIDYDTGAIAAGDSYEPDNNCTAAPLLRVNGAAQNHTISGGTPTDEDWLQLPVAASASYTLIIQGHDPALTAAVYASCEAGSAPIQTASAGAPLYLSFTSNVTTTYYARITLASAAPSALAYTVTLQQAAPTGLAVIVAGAVPGNDAQQALINASANLAYLTLRQHGYTADQIRYLSPLSSQDVDGNGAQDDVDAPPTLSEIYAALQDNPQISELTADKSLLIYLVGRFATDQFFLDEQAVLTSATLDRWLANLEATTPVNQIGVILEGSASGAWIDPQAPQTDSQPLGQQWRVTGPNRIVIASTNATATAWPGGHGLLFSDTFWTALRMGYNLHQSFQIGKAIGKTAGCVWPSLPTFCQTPWLDDSDNGEPNLRSDGRLATSWSLAAPERTMPQIMRVTSTHVQVSSTLMITATVLNGAQLGRVEAQLLYPDMQPVWPPDAAFPTRTATVISLHPSTTANSGDGVIPYTGLYTQQVPAGTVIVVYGWDLQQLPILPTARLVDQRALIYLPIIQR